MFETISKFIEEAFSALSRFFDACLRPILNFEWSGAVTPFQAKAVFLVLFVFIGLLVSMAPKAYIYQGLERPRWWHNLKLWAWGVLLFIFVTYCVF